MSIVYKGFSTVGKLSPPFIISDIELVKIDLLNTFNTRLGERVMMPSFGSIIHDLLMDPLDAISTDRILNDVKRVISLDPRVKLTNTPKVTELDLTIRIEISLFFVMQNTADHLYLSFKRALPT